jgi:cytochrome b involved in lipid metabolism
MKYILSIATVLILAGAGCSSAPTTPTAETPTTPPPVEIQEPSTSTPTIPSTTTPTTTKPVVTTPVITPPPVVVTPPPADVPPPAPAVKSYTMAEIAAANTESNCLTVINGIVYNLTAFVNRHPGGDRNILRICGMDGTSAFNGQHGGESKPENILATFDVGVLKK